jgi:hypothetical protein
VVEEVAAPADKLGVYFRAYIDAGFALADPAAALKNKGEA